MTMHSWIRKLFPHPVTHTVRNTRRQGRLNLETLDYRYCPTTFTVLSNLDDGSDDTLRWAIAEANANPGPDTIDFDSSISQIVLSGTQLQLTDITGATTVNGPSVTVNANGLSRVFQVDAGVTASFTGLTITGGSVAGNGAGLLNLGTTTLTDCTVSGNHAIGGIDDTTGTVTGVGGGVGSLGGTLDLVDCTISGNTADFVGGGVANAGIPAIGGGKGSTATPAVPGLLSMSDSTVSGNSAGLGSGVVNGVPSAQGGGKGATTFGAIGPSTLNMSNSVVSGNLAVEDGTSVGSTGGGAGFGVANLGNASLTSCTISGNEGGGVLNNGASTGGGKGSTVTVGGLNMTNSTVSENLMSEFVPTSSGGGKGSTAPPTDVFGFGVVNQGNATITNSTIDGNEAGGVSNNSTASGGAKGSAVRAPLKLINSTISGHLASAEIPNSGFGVLNSTSVALINTTISGNDGGVNNLAGGALLLNTIVAGNTSADLQGTGFSGTNNLIGTGGSGEFLDGVNANIVLTDLAGLLLAPLDDYGGPTRTMHVLPGSAAINNGTPAFTTLAAAIDDASVTSITVADTTGFGIGLYIKVDNEIMRVTGVTNATTLTVARGQLGTTAAAHNATITPSTNVTLAADQRGVTYAGLPDIGAFELNDSQPPTATVVVDDSLLTIDETSLVTFTFSEHVTGFTTADLTVANGVVSGLSSADGGITWTGTLTPTAGLIAPTNVITLNNAGVTDLAGNAGVGTTNSNNYAIDTKPVTTVSSITRTTPSGQFTNASSVSYTVTFADATLGLTADDFDLTGTAGIADTNIGTPITSDDGLTWAVPITGLTGSNGTLILNLVNTADLDHTATNLPFEGETYTLDSVAPTLTISGPSVPLTVTGPVTFTITYPDSDLDLNSIDLTSAITLNTTGTANGTISSVTGTGKTRIVTISGITGDGTLGISVAAGTATDTAGNMAVGAGPSATVNVDRDKPTVAISAPSQSFAKTGNTVTYTITYTDTTLQNVTLTAANVTLITSGSAKGTVQVSGTGNTRTVTITNITGDGTLGISIKAGTAIDAIGQKAPAAGPSQKFVVDNTAPKLTIGAPVVTARKVIFTTAVDYIITITETNLASVTLTESDITLVSATGITATKVVTKIDATHYRVSLSNFSGHDSVGISVAAGVSQDAAGAFSVGPINSAKLLVYSFA